MPSISCKKASTGLSVGGSCPEKSRYLELCPVHAQGSLFLGGLEELWDVGR